MDNKAAFEKWFEAVEAGDDENWQVPKYLSPEWNQYMFRHQLALGAWLASRAEIEIELPQRQSLCASGYGDGYFVPSDVGEGLEYDEVVEVLTSHGIRVKGKTE